jgi:hypothetical protein
MLAYGCRSDASIDHTAIYTAFSDIVTAVPPDAVTAQTDVDGIIAGVIRRRVGENAGKQLHAVLKIMILAFISARVRRRAELLLIETEQG